MRVLNWLPNTVDWLECRNLHPFWRRIEGRYRPIYVSRFRSKAGQWFAYQTCGGIIRGRLQRLLDFWQATSR